MLPVVNIFVKSQNNVNVVVAAALWLFFEGIEENFEHLLFLFSATFFF